MCALAGVSLSGYYKWRKRDGVPNGAKRERILRLVAKCHEAHSTHGYRWVHAYLGDHERGFDVSADYVRRCFRFLGIEAKAKHKRKNSVPRLVKDPYPNLIFTTWETIDRPRQVIVSDMTAFKCGWWSYYELTLYFDAFTKQIIGSGLGDGKGGNSHYYSGLDQTVTSIERAREESVGKLEAGSGDITLIHTDQGSVYTSMAYNEIIREHGIVRSCSRAGKPTDNPVNESLNGWIKEELFIDFHLGEAKSSNEVALIIDEYVRWYNSERPCWSLGYKTPDAFYEAYRDGEAKHRDTFANRVLDDTPKFLRKKLARAEKEAEN
ncbi:MAG: IS3 family transposase, partial [Gordonibacter sp.]|uniref:IS3 family transposase n=1 Tax=Gordonibacter sp. TaxID=1968902 RepID=UPI002FCC402A